MLYDLLERRKEKFVLWIPGGAEPPSLVLGTIDGATPANFTQLFQGQLVQANNIRFFTDVVMAFGHDPYVYIAFDQFHIQPYDPNDPGDNWQSHRDNQLRDGYGGRSWKYIENTTTYDPKSGQTQVVHPSWAFHQGHLHRWMSDFGVAINYITSHDVEGYRKERLYNFLDSNGIIDKETRSKFAFALLLTAVGIPMIFAGEEFCDQMDRPIGQKQIDPVNYERKAEPWRSAVFNYVANLVRFREQCPALGDDDTNFFFTDESRGGKIMAWTRGGSGNAPVVVVANFTDEDTPGTEYVIDGWPDQDRDDWREVSQGRDVPREWVGREPLMQWEVKIYTYWK
ncbi:glycoside hydrolase family 13 protein [Mollisia scopiformis]|uniref:Glycoside hydrolase family 13 protein n=1 Tax=Mollisia scopiformis TaxID=149040 RepID=A0A194WVS1_MOLSC|nr:glycoside hydrolase family 13 protein [Mollisia scopiformis]KUJ11682.1 glycoside hydrolase family 13 protein [Mollisia scopiformis]